MPGPAQGFSQFRLSETQLNAGLFDVYVIAHVAVGFGWLIH
jgi:hypothetical protein